MGNLQLSPGSVFANRFEIQHAAGSGGMGTVYRAADRYSGDIVALKLLHAGANGSDEAERFAREAQLLSELRHPGIVEHVAHGQTPDGQRFLAMEWLDGQDLGERLSRGPLPVRDCLSLLDQVADALSLAHRRGIIHRDLKPSNLFLIGGDISRIKIIDFGIARRVATSQAMTKTGMVIGTPEYMAPEQARGSRELNPAADVFSLGCVLYECLSGQPPFVADHIAAMLVRILFEEPVPIAERRPGVSQSLASLLGRMLAKNSEQRIGNASALRTELLTLGELPEPALAVTMDSLKPKAESFSAQEQSLFSIVLAAAPEEDIVLGATQGETGVRLAATDRRALLQALAALDGSPEFLANGTLVVTVPPLGSAQDQATVAARTALLIKQRWPNAVVSMATGRGTVRGRAAVGEVVELAARSLSRGSHPSMGKPESGVLVDPLSAKLLTGRFAQTPQPGGALLLHEERDVDVVRTLLGKPTPYVGRDAELSNLDAQLTSCIDESEARAVLITAPPGVGKSRLRHEFLRRIAKRSEPITILLGRGDMMSAGAPYGILRTAIHKLCGISGSEALDTQRECLRTRIAQHLAAADAERVLAFIGELCSVPFPDEGKPMLQAARQEPKIMRDCLRRAFLDFLLAECTVAPVLLVLDDLQWGDELTVSILDDAMRELSGARLFLLSFARPEVHETFPKLWGHHKVQEIPLKGLSKKACERLMVQVLGKDVSPEAIAGAVEQCGGNALFLEELIRSHAEGNLGAKPETVVAMLQARIGRLDSNVRRTVRAASIFGQTFWRRGVEALLGLTADATEVAAWLSALVAAELIQSHTQSRLATQAEYGFRHALVRDAAYGLLADGDLMTGHRLAAKFLEEAGESNAAMLAEHLERGGELQRAATCYLQAAETHLERFDVAGAMRNVDRGVLCAPEAAVLGKLRSLECFTAVFLDQHERVARVCDDAITLVRPGSLDWCRVAPGAYLVAALRQDGLRAMQLLTLLLSTEPDANAQLVYLVGIITLCAMLSVGAPAPLLDTLLQRITDCVERWASKNPTLRPCLHAARVQLATSRQPKPWTLVTEAEIALRLAREMGDNLTDLALNTHLIAWGWLDLGAREKMEAHLKALQAPVSQTQNRTLDGFFRNVFARVLADSTDESAWSEAERVITPLLSRTDGLALFPSLANGILARVALQRGQQESAEAQSRAAMAALPSAPAWFPPIAAVQIRALLGLGRPRDATQVAEQMLSFFPVLGSAGVFEVEFRVAASQAFHAANDRGRAHAELHETLRQIELRADDIKDPFWKNSYRTRNPCCVRAQALAKEWGLDVPVE